MISTTHAQLSSPSSMAVLLDPIPVARTRRPRFSQELHDLAQQFAGRPACLSGILAATEGRGFNLLLLLIGLLLLTAVPLPGFSTLFGFVVQIGRASCKAKV